MRYNDLLGKTVHVMRGLNDRSNPQERSRFNLEWRVTEVNATNGKIVLRSTGNWTKSEMTWRELMTRVNSGDLEVV